MSTDLSLDLAPQEVNEIIQDMDFRKGGTQIHFVFDPHELYDFCFPMDPGTHRVANYDKLSNDQVALYELFYRFNNKPILMDDYESELENINTYITHQIESAKDKNERINQLISYAQIDPETYKKNIDSLIDANFNTFLAINLGIYSLGKERFNQIYPQRLRKMSEILTNTIKHEETELASKIYDRFLRKHGGSANAKDYKTRITIQRDAKAIDRIISINTAFFQSAKSKAPKNLFLYISSAERSKTIFELDVVARKLQKVKNKPYSYLRSREQVFAYIFSRTFNTQGKIDFDETIRNLENLRDIQFNLKFISDNPFLNSMKIKPLNIRRHGMLQEYEMLGNWGLVKNIENYNQVVSQVKSKDFKSYIDLLKFVANNSLNSEAPKKFQELQEIMLIKSQFTSDMLKTDMDGTDTPALRRLPELPQLMDESVNKIASTLQQAVELSPAKKGERDKILNSVLKNFLAKDINIQSIISEHEILRTLLYLSFPDSKANSTSYEHIKKLRDHADARQYSQELDYIECWVLSHFEKDRGKIIRFFNQCVQDYSKDPRFYHARGFYRGELSETEKLGIDEMKECKADFETALFLIDQSKSTHREIQQACLNNLAYMKTKDPFKNIEEARVFIDKLKKETKYFEKTTDHPHKFRYLHTEACVEFEEVVILKSQKAKKETIKNKINSAFRIIRQALDIEPAEKALTSLLKKLKALDVDNNRKGENMAAKKVKKVRRKKLNS